VDGRFPLDLAPRSREGGEWEGSISAGGREIGGAGANSASSSDSDSFFNASIHDHWCFGRAGESSFSSSSSSSTLVSWEDTILSPIPCERATGESEIEVSPSTSVPNDLSASGGSSEGRASTRLEPYDRVARCFAEIMGGDGGGGEEVGGAVLGELFKEVIGSAPLDTMEATLWTELSVVLRSLMATLAYVTET